jgi:undecaprenyl-diphosphatase
MALCIGLVQCLAMWPGTSRSLATILGGLFAGLTLGAAVEFSFLLGVVTLTASTALDALKYGPEILKIYGVVSPLVGLATAAVSAALAVKWMVSYLQQHPLAIFGYYRVLLAIGVGAMLIAR